MDNYSVILLILVAVLLSSTACLLGVLITRRQSSSVSSFNYPVPEEKAPPAEEQMLEEAPATVYEIADKRRSELLEKFKIYMIENKPYLNNRVSLETVAVKLGTNKTTLSKLINDKFGMNFRQLLNSYRVKEAMELFSKNNKMTTEELKKASGFKSISTFTSSFSRFTGCTPGEYCKKVTGR